MEFSPKVDGQAAPAPRAEKTLSKLSGPKVPQLRRSY